VRLKVIFGDKRILNIDISIPFGAIKRELMAEFVTAKGNFNSFWCD